MKNKAIITLILTIAICSCSNNKENSKLSHGIITKPNYSIVFPNNKVNRIDFKIEPEIWEEMNADLQSETHVSDKRPDRRPDKMQDKPHLALNERGFREKPKNLDDSIQFRPGGMNPGPPPPGLSNNARKNPIWIYGDVFFNNQKWAKVGMRFKGNSSLRATAESGLKKFSFKLDFDQFEDQFPEINNQRFYGFKKLNLQNNYDDPSFIREKVATDLFASFGLKTASTAFYQLFVDYGSGPKYFGLYTLVEDVDDTVLNKQYADGTGNLYKPDGNAGSFASGTYLENQFGKKNNLKQNDYSDLKNLYTLINSSKRITSPTEWKVELEKVFNIDIFLKWLAANTVMQNWDTYGNMAHNYYLYNNPADGKLNWIPWDNNEAFQYGKQPGALTLDLNSVSYSWPLIRYIINDADYKLKYQAYLKQFITEVFTPAKMTALYTSYYNLLKESAYSEVNGFSFIKSDAEFDRAINTLKNHVIERNTAVNTYLN